MEAPFQDSVGIALECSQNPLFFIFFERLNSGITFFQYFFSRWSVVNNSKNKKVAAFLQYFTGFETITFYTFF